MQDDVIALFASNSAVPPLNVLCAKAVGREIATDPDSYLEEFKDLPLALQAPVFYNTPYPALTSFMMDGGYELLSSDKLNMLIKFKENYYRHLFAQDRANWAVLGDPYLTLFPVYRDSCPLLLRRELSSQELEVPTLFNDVPSTVAPGQPCLCSAEQFRTQWNVFTEEQLADLDWHNVICAGGAVLASCVPVSAESSCNKRALREYLHQQFPSSDIDLFIYGLNEAQATAKVQHIVDTVQNNNPTKCVLVRSQHAVSIVSQYPYRHVQIVLRLYQSPAEVLMGFDVDCCCAGYDGTDLWMLPRCLRAVTAGYNLVDLSRRSPSYEVRLAKYARRGFRVAVPGLDLARVDPAIYSKSLRELSGLGRLLLLAEYRTSQQRAEHDELLLKLKEHQRDSHVFSSGIPPAWMRVGQRRNTGHDDGLLQSVFADALADKALGERREEAEVQQAMRMSDYGAVFLPWGPRWTAKRIVTMLRLKDNALNSPAINGGIKRHAHPCFYARTVSAVMEDVCGKCPDVSELPEKEQTNERIAQRVEGEAKWITADPGRQYIGSFHPSDGDWQLGVYLDSPAQKLFDAAAAHNTTTALAILTDSGLTSVYKDSSARTVLHVACMSGQTDLVRALLACNGVSLAAKTTLGQTALHLCAVYGMSDCMKLLLQHEAMTPVQMDELDERHHCALHYAVCNGFVDCAVALLEHGANPNVADDLITKFTAMHYAVMTKRVEMVELLLDHKANIDPVSGRPQVTPLHIAVCVGSLECMRVLLQRGCDRDAPDGMSFTPLHMAVQQQHIECVRELLAHDADKEATLSSQCQGHTPLMLAVLQCSLPIVKILLEAGVDVNTPSVRGQTALDIAYMAPGRNRLDNPMRSRHGLHLSPAAMDDMREITQLLLTHGAVTFSRTTAATQLPPANFQGFLAPRRLRADATYHSPEEELAQRELGARLLVAIEANDLATVESLCEESHTVTYKDPAGRSLGIVAAMLGHLEVLKVLLRFGVSLDVDDATGRSPYHVAAACGHLALVQFMSPLVASVYRMDKFQQSAIDYACYFGHLDIVRYIIDIVPAKTRSLQLRSPMLAAAMGGHLDVIKLLVDTDRDFLTCDAEQYPPPFAVAAARGHVAAMEYLLDETHADVNVPLVAREQRTEKVIMEDLLLVLHQAAALGHVDVVKALLRRGADVNAMDTGRIPVTALMAACAYGQVECVQVLLDAGAKIIDTPSASTLLYACGQRKPVSKKRLRRNALSAPKYNKQQMVQRYAQCVKLLLERGANVNVRIDRSLLTPALWAAFCDHVPVLELLLEYKADINVTSKEGFTPLLAALRAKSVSTAAMLLNAGADASIVGPDNLTALHMAAAQGACELIAQLAKVDEDVAWESLHGFTAWEQCVNELHSVHAGVHLYTYDTVDGLFGKKRAAHRSRLVQTLQQLHQAGVHRRVRKVRPVPAARGNLQEFTAEKQLAMPMPLYFPDNQFDIK